MKSARVDGRGMDSSRRIPDEQIIEEKFRCLNAKRNETESAATENSYKALKTEILQLFKGFYRVEGWSSILESTLRRYDDLSMLMICADFARDEVEEERNAMRSAGLKL